MELRVNKHPYSDTVGFDSPVSIVDSQGVPCGEERSEHSPEPIVQAVVMAGGKGTRLYPYSAHFPKPLVPLHDMPILELLLRQLKMAGVTDVILAVGHLRHLIEAYFGDGSTIGLRIVYHGEECPLGTAGALGSMFDRLDRNFFVTNGDLLTTLDLERMSEQHAMMGADASVGVFKRDVKLEFGLVEVDASHRMIAYREKPENSYLVSMGLYILKREAVRPHVSAQQYLDMPELLLRMRAAGKDVRCFQDDCIWFDIGRPDDFARAQELFATDRQLFLGS
jgi:NDP-mannose synthase